MSHVQYLDEIVKEYLLFRGFFTTLKTYDAELKTDKDKGFRVRLYTEAYFIFCEINTLMIILIGGQNRRPNCNFCLQL
jgi:hypothetical protein